MAPSPEDRLRTFVAVAAKINQAIAHLESLEAAARRYTEDHGQSGLHTVIQLNPQRTKLRVVVNGDVKFPDLEWGIIIGDAVHCLRSGLDQLVSGLCTEKPTSSTRFPTCRTEREWIVDAPRMYWSVPPAYVAVLDRVQPYHRGDQAHSHPIAILNALWNLDKHSSIPAAALVPATLSVLVNEVRGMELGAFRTNTGVALKRGAVIAEASITHYQSDAEAHVDMNAQLLLNVGFGIVRTAPSLNLKSVGDTFHGVLIPEVMNVLRAAKAVHDAQTS